MRVMFWSESFWPYIGGAEVFATRLIPALRTRGHDFMIVTRRDSTDLPDEEEHQGIPIRRFPFWTTLTSRDVAQIMNIRKQIITLKRSFMPDLVHLHGFCPSILFHLETAKTHPAPFLATLTEERPEADQPAERNHLERILRAAHWVTGKANAVLAQARGVLPEICDRSSVIRNGIKIPDCPTTPLPFATPRLLCLGRMAKQKGFDLALSALSLIVKRFPYARLIIAGDGPERPALEKQIAELGLIQNVDLLGWVAPNDVPALINTVTMVVMPSRWEGLPSVGLQGSMMARPIVATSVGGLTEIVVHRETGWLVQPEDYEKFAQAVIYLLEHPKIAIQMGLAGRLRIQEVFSWDHCVNQYDALYNQLVTRWGHRKSAMC